MGVSYVIPSATRLTAMTRMEAETVGRALNEFVKRHEENLYGQRAGSFVLDGQACLESYACGGASILNLGYKPARTILKGTLPGGASSDGSIATTDLAGDAIDCLLNGGATMFEDWAGRYVPTGIYHPLDDVALDDGIDVSADNLKIARQRTGLMVLNTTFGRFLMGTSEVPHNSDASYEYDFLLIAAATILYRMFPYDRVVLHEYAWLRRHCPIHDVVLSEFEQDVVRIFDEGEVLSDYHAYIAESPNRAKHLPFADFGDK